MAAAAVFFATYAALAAGRVPILRLDRTAAAIVGAVLMVATGSISFDQAVRSVDHRTIILLFGMMVIVAHMRLAGGLAALVSTVTAKLTHPAALLLAVIVASGALSALFVNDTICLVFTPVVMDLADARGHRPLPYLLALATASNIGSVAAITGNPQNMLIGSVSGLSFLEFSRALVPVAVMGLALDALLIWLVFRGELHRLPARTTGQPSIPLNRLMLAISLAVSGLVLAGLLAGFDPAIVGAVGAALLFVTRQAEPRAIYNAIDWDLLLLFVGLFVVVGGAEHSGLDRQLFDVLARVGSETAAGLTMAVTILSNIVSNVPAVMLFVGFIPRLRDADQAWLLLAMSSTLAGNLTILGSIANLIVVEGARRRGTLVTFFDYGKIGIPITVLTIMTGLWWLS